MTAYLSFLKPIRQACYRDKDYAHAWRLIEPLIKKPDPKWTPEELRAVGDLAATIMRARLQFKEALVLYEAIGDDYQAGYCLLLMKDLEGLRPHWTRVLEQRNNHWCLTLFGLANQQLSTVPTMFQIRQYLEGDISNFLLADCKAYVKSAISYANELGQINLESPKFIGRALLNSDKPEWLEEAGKLLLLGQKLLPNDPEVYYHLAQARIKQKETKDAILMLKQALMINPTFMPAQDLMVTL